MLVASMWKGVDLKCPPLYGILLVHQDVEKSTVLWDLEIFHNHLRKVSAPRWLRRLQGGRTTCNVAQCLDPSLDCRWVPSQQMLTGHGSSEASLPGVDRSLKSGTTVMATIPWILAYLLTTNIIRVIGKAHGHLRQKAFRLLRSLVQLACSSAQAEDRRISTSFGAAVINEDGLIIGDDAWEEHMSFYKDRCVRILTHRGCGHGRKGADFAEVCSPRSSAAAALWHWALVT